MQHIIDLCNSRMDAYMMIIACVLLLSQAIRIVIDIREKRRVNPIDELDRALQRDVLIMLRTRLEMEQAKYDDEW